MDDLERYRQRLRVRQAALRRLGATNVFCICGEDDPTCFEADHVYRRELNGTCWALCKNCHAKRTARGWSEHPSILRGDPEPMQRMVHLLLGTADYQEFIAAELRKAAEVLVERWKDSKRE